MKCAGHSKSTVLGVVMSTIAIVGLIVMGLAISERGPFNKRSDSSLTPNGGNSGAPLPSGAPEPSAPAIRLIVPVFALQRLGVPSDLLREFFEHANANEWKCLKFAFNRTLRTEVLFKLIGLYADARSAAKGGKDFPEVRRYMGSFSSTEQIQIRLRDGDRLSHKGSVKVGIDKNDRIVTLEILGLTDDDIWDLSFLPKRLKRLCVTKGSLTHINMSELPRGLENVDFSDNQISQIVIESVPPSLGWLVIQNNPLQQGITFKTPLPISNKLSVFMSPQARNVPLDLNGGTIDYWNFVTLPCGSIIHLYYF